MGILHKIKIQQVAVAQILAAVLEVVRTTVQAQLADRV
jgi:hypothetical protein